MNKNPNPQGKGTSPVLATLETQRAGLAQVPPKQIDQVTTELFTSLFVLDSEFRFKPVVGKRYFLYRKETHFWLGLTPPGMLGEAVAGRFIGTCTLQRDLTWTMALDAAVAADDRFIAYLGQRRAQLESRLAAAETLDDVLPRYERRLSFYRRAAAFAVACSLGRSMAYAGIGGLSYDQARGLLTHAAEETGS
ncbi:DUF2452 domain-containing protein [Salinisphaera aquimarina]|uniref:DUF2452 domain-containing protein n=1 Tax=Salinisphaera aquimarina TaxID=2094031 RepID=A0ABV7EMN5_9GAMM